MESKLNKKAVLDMKEQIINDLKVELDEEMKKSPKKRDYNKIDEITAAIHEIDCENDDYESHYEDARNELFARLEKEKNRKSRRRLKGISIVATCCVLLIGINAVTFSTMGMNMFKAIYHISKGGITVDIERSNEIILPTTKDDPYGIKAKCAEYDINLQAPTFIPEGFYLYDINYEENDTFKRVDFFYKNVTAKINFTFTNFKGDVPPIGLPTDTYELNKETINDQIIYTLKEDNQFYGIFIKENIQYLIFTEYIDYDSCYKIVNSLLN